MKIKLNSIFVQNQASALKFYTEVLGFEKKTDIPIGEFRWLTVVSPEDPDGTELVLEPANNPDGIKFQNAMLEQGIPMTAFEVNDIRSEFDGLKSAGVEFTQEPTSAGPVETATFNDTCGNLIQIYQIL